jgi:uncharacterized radical SAM superfamily protein
MNQYIDTTLTQLRRWFQVPQTDLEPLFKQARQITDKFLGRRISLFTPSERFPSISITGRQCKLNCQHCGGRYLRHMKHITRPDQLISFCQKLAANQGLGCLVSGGCDASGRVPLAPFLPALREIKQSTSLFINVHTGFLTDNDAQQLAKTGIDCASVDVVGDNATIHKIYGLTGRSTQDYRATLQALKTNNISVSPHICVGLQFGKLAGELNALHIIQETVEPSAIVIIALVPSQKTPMETTPPPSNYDIARICAITRALFPKTEIALGCMRPRGRARREMEQLAIEAGVTRIAVPTQTTLKYLKENGYKISVNHTCCVA